MAPLEHTIVTVQYNELDLGWLGATLLIDARQKLVRYFCLEINPVLSILFRLVIVSEIFTDWWQALNS